MSPQARNALLATACAAVTAALLLVLAVLPAEYGWDPTGLGARLDLVGFSGSRPDALRGADRAPLDDRVAFTLEPFESLEYKYRMSPGDTLVFSWQAQGELVYDMHAQPDGAAPGYAESFDKGRAVSAQGSYRAGYGGIHGWFWQNRGGEAVTLTLETRGFHSGAVELRDGREVERGF